MKFAPLAEVKDKLSAFVNDSQQSPVVITKNGKPVALLTGIAEDDDIDSLLLAYNPRFLEILREARARVQKTGGIKQKDFWKQMAQRRQAARK